MGVAKLIYSAGLGSTWVAGSGPFFSVPDTISFLKRGYSQGEQLISIKSSPPFSKEGKYFQVSNLTWR